MLHRSQRVQDMEKLNLFVITNIGGLMKNVKYLALMTLLSACSSHRAMVMDRSDDLSNRPEWANLEKSSYEKDNKHYFMAFVEVDGTSSKSAALNMSDEKALSDPMRSVVSEFLDQNQIGEELRKDDIFARRIISATRGYRPPMPSLKIVHRYWEKTTDQIGKTELRAFSLATISVADFEQAKDNYLAKLRGDPEVKKILEDVGAKQRENILNKDSKAEIKE